MFRQQSFFSITTVSEENRGDTVFLRRRSRPLPQGMERYTKHTLIFPDASPLERITLTCGNPYIGNGAYLEVRVKSFVQTGFLKKHLPNASVPREMFTGRDNAFCSYSFEQFDPTTALHYMKQIFIGVRSIDTITAAYFTAEREQPFIEDFLNFHQRSKSAVLDGGWETREEPVQETKNNVVNEALEMAIDNYEVDTVEKLLAEGADPNSFTSNGYTMLRFVFEKCPLFACEENKIEETEKLSKILELLMLHNANPLLKSHDGSLPETEAVFRSEIFGPQSVISSIICEMINILKARATPSKFKVPEEAKNLEGVNRILQGNAAIKKRLTPKPGYKKITPPTETNETGGFAYKFETYNGDSLNVSVKRANELTSEEVDFLWKLFKEFELDKNKNEKEFVNYFWNELSDHGRPRYICILYVTKKDKTSYIGGFLTFEGYPTTLNDKEAFIVYIPLSKANPQVSADFERSMTYISKLIGQALAKSFDGKVNVQTMFEAASKYPLLQMGLEDLEMSLNSSEALKLVPQACAAVYGVKESLNLIRCGQQVFKIEPLTVSASDARGEKQGCRTFAHIVGARYESLKQASNLLDPREKALVSLVLDNPHNEEVLEGRFKLTRGPEAKPFPELASDSAPFFRKLFEPAPKVPYALKDKEEKKYLFAKL